MEKAFFYASKALEYEEIPVGAVLVYDNYEISGSFNLSVSKNDPTAHAEINSLRLGALKLNNYRLPKTTLYVTLEPCLMCLGALFLARVRRLVFGAYKRNTNIFLNNNAKMIYNGGVLEKESLSLLKKFFLSKRN